MSDQTPSLSNVPTIDFTNINVIGLPSGAATSFTDNFGGSIVSPASVNVQLLFNGGPDPSGLNVFQAGAPGANDLTVLMTFAGWAGGPPGNGNLGLVQNPALVGATAITDYYGADGTFRPIPGGIASINGDATPAQVIAAGQGLTLLNAGATHTLSVGLGIIGQFTPAGVALPNGVLTPVASRTILAGEGGQYLVNYGGGVAGIAAQFMDVVVRLNAAVIVGFGFSGITESAVQDLHVTGSAGIVILVPGDVLDIAIDHHGGGAATTSLETWLQGIRVQP